MMQRCTPTCWIGVNGSCRSPELDHRGWHPVKGCHPVAFNFSSIPPRGAGLKSFNKWYRNVAKRAKDGTPPKESPKSYVQLLGLSLGGVPSLVTLTLYLDYSLNDLPFNTWSYCMRAPLLSPIKRRLVTISSALASSSTCSSTYHCNRLTVARSFSASATLTQV
ncbi:MAG: hypothetical protein BWY72_00730 [Bacteroidetes bacterium ADurb.Bin416]|nr:MAG: hypothetical protein BWY72_00730 [Bacteroidetes bacterium ADurb.Bin416]